jgi:hypothetical protein
MGLNNTNHNNSCGMVSLLSEQDNINLVNQQHQESLLHQLSMNQLNPWNTIVRNNSNPFMTKSPSSIFEPLNMNDSTASLSNMAHQYNSFLRQAIHSSISMNQFHHHSSTNPIQQQQQQASMTNAIFNIPTSSSSGTNTTGITSRNLLQNRMLSSMKMKPNNNYCSSSSSSNSLMQMSNLLENPIEDETTSPFARNQFFQDFAFRSNNNNNNNRTLSSDFAFRNKNNNNNNNYNHTLSNGNPKPIPRGHHLFSALNLLQTGNNYNNHNQN